MVSIKEPYLISSWQLANLAALFDGLLASTHVRVVKLSTHRRSDTGTIDVLCQHYLPMGLGIAVLQSCRTGAWTSTKRLLQTALGHAEHRR